MKILTLNKIIEVECVFLAIDQKHLPYDLCFEVAGHFTKRNTEQYVYLLWLINRWILIRKHKYELPPRRDDSLCLDQHV